MLKTHKKPIIILTAFCLLYFLSISFVAASTFENKSIDKLILIAEVTDPECTSIFGANSETKEILKEIFDFIRFLAPVLVLIFSIIDFIKALSANDAEETKKAGIKFMKRIIIALAIFLVPTLLNIFLEIIDTSTCGIG